VSPNQRCAPIGWNRSLGAKEHGGGGACSETVLRWQIPGPCAADVMRRADGACYGAKRLGGGQVVIAGALPAPEPPVVATA